MKQSGDCWDVFEMLMRRVERGEGTCYFHGKIWRDAEGEIQHVMRAGPKEQEAK